MEQEQHVCPVWVGKLMISPIRKLFQNPQKILKKYVHPEMKVLEIGPALGFFSLPIAKMVGKKGKVYCVDIQSEMLEKLEHRAIRAQVFENLETRLSSQSSLNIEDLNEQIDFAFLFAVVHEIPNKSVLFSEISNSLKTGSKILFAEPRGHVTIEQFEESIRIAESNNIKRSNYVSIKGSHGIILQKL